jgi:hypothetical protein
MRGIFIAVIVIGVIAIASRPPDEGASHHNNGEVAEPVAAEPEFTG